MTGPSQKQLEALGEQIDQLINIDVTGRGVIQPLFRAALQVQKAPMSLSAARRLLGVKPCSSVVMATGWTNRPHVSLDVAETDGPIGVALLARALAVNTKALPIVLIEAQFVDRMAQVIESAGLRVLPFKEAVLAATSPAPISVAAVLPSPTAIDEAEAQAVWLLDAANVAAVVAVEKGGLDAAGRVMTTRGQDLANLVGKVDPLVRLANNRGVPTIGIGDAGNEIGFGVLKASGSSISLHPEAARSEKFHGALPATPVDVLVTAAVSNWGVTAILGCLWALTGEARYLHPVEVEKRVFEGAMSAGFIDGGSGLLTMAADGVSFDASVGVLELIRSLVGLSTE